MNPGVATRRVSALGVSFAVHVVAAIAIALVAPSLKPAARRLNTRPPIAFVSARESAAPQREAAPNRKGAILPVSVGRPLPAVAPSAPVPDDLSIPLDASNAEVSLPGFVFDFEKIVKRATRLFPFVTGPIPLEALGAPPRSSVTDFLAGLVRRQVKPPLALSDSELQALVDGSWSRRDRWQAFEPVAVLVDRHDADAGRVPALLREYGAQNGLQPFGEAIVRDARLWAQLGLAADHAEFIDFIGRFSGERPSSKATTELLFLLDKLAQGSLDALLTLIATDPEADMQWTLGASHHAFNAVVTIRDYYLRELERRELESPRVLTMYYDQVRLAILGSIVRTTPDGYRTADARFLMGEILWNRGRRDDAVQVWSEMPPDPDAVYAAPAAQILDVLGASNGRLDVRRIGGILDSEQGRWMMSSVARLRRFGHRLDTF